MRDKIMQNRVAPVREGEELDVQIEAVGGKGDGIARKNGFVLFVAGTKAGDQVRVRITKVLPKAGFAEVIGKVEKPVQQSREPRAPRPEKPAEPEFEIDTSKDSEDFGEE